MAPRVMVSTEGGATSRFSGADAGAVGSSRARNHAKHEESAGVREPTTDFATLRLPEKPTVTAPDGSDVRVLLSLAGGSMAHFELAPGQVARAVVHKTVEELWFIVAGRGEMWRKQGEREEIVALEPGVCLTIPVGTHFQFRASASERVAAVAVTMPPWPGEGEAQFVRGHWAI